MLLCVLNHHLLFFVYIIYDFFLLCIVNLSIKFEEKKLQVIDYDMCAQQSICSHFTSFSSSTGAPSMRVRPAVIRHANQRTEIQGRAAILILAVAYSSGSNLHGN